MGLVQLCADSIAGGIQAGITEKTQLDLEEFLDGIIAKISVSISEGILSETP